MGSAQRRRKRRAAWAGCWLCLYLASSSGLRAENAGSDRGVLQPSAAAAGVEQHVVADAKQKRESLWLAFMMLGGIIVGGTLLLLLVVMWGNRTRRLARRPLPEVAQRNELWFLKPKRLDEAEPGRAEPGESGESAAEQRP